MLENIFSYLREKVNNEKQVDLNCCLVHLSKFFIDGGEGIDFFPKLKISIEKYVHLNPKRTDIKSLTLWWEGHIISAKVDMLSHMFAINKKYQVIIPSPKRAKRGIVVNRENKIKPFEVLYDRMVSTRCNIDRDKAPYIWQWAITASEYEEICSTVEICKSFDSKDVADMLDNEKCIFIVVAYVAERYKREWFGNDGEDNALKQLGLEDKAAQIAGAYFGDRKEELIFKHITPERTIHEYLDSLRVDGGLPIRYIVEGDNQLTHFIEIIYRDYKKAIKFLLEKLNNSCIRYSYESKHSIYSFINCLLTEDGIYNVYGEDSENINIFKTFTTILKNERKKAQRESHKFDVEYSVWRWRSSDEFAIHQNISFKESSSFNESNDIISRDRFEHWGINPTYAFWIRVGKTDYKFHPWKSNYYRSIQGTTRILLDDIDTSKSNLPKVNITYIPQAEDGSKDLKHARSIPDAIVPRKDFILFSSNDGHRWHQNNSGIYSAALIIKPSTAVEGTFDELELEGGMRWIEFDGKIQINGQIIYSSKNTIIPKDIARAFFCKWIKNIKCIHKGRVEPIYLLSASKIKPSNFERVDENGERRNIEGRIYYKDNILRRYVPLDTNNPPIGLTSLRIDNICFKAYIQHDSVSISRDIANKFIIIRGLEASHIEVEPCKDFQISSTGNYVKISDRYNTDKIAEVIPVTIRLEDLDISMDIVRPLKRRDRIMRGCVLEMNQNIPKNLASQYRIREFNENGVIFLNDKVCSQKYSNKEIQLEQNRYIVDKGKNASIEPELQFAFWATSGKIYPLSIQTDEVYQQGNNITIFYLTGVPADSQGYIIQTLEISKPKLTYYKPKEIGFSSRNKENIKSEFIKEISAIDRLITCIRHGLYMEDFMNKKDFSAELFIQYVDLCHSETIDITFKKLWEFATAIQCNWLLIPKTEWKTLIRKGLSIEDINTLLENYSDIDRDLCDTLKAYIDAFWSYEWKSKRPSRRSSPEKNFLYYITTGMKPNDEYMAVSLPDLTIVLDEINK